MFQEDPERLLVLEQLLAGAHRLAPWRSLALLAAQLHHPLQRLLNGQPDRLTRSPQGQPVRSSSLPLVPVLKQLLPQLRQLGSELGAGAAAFGDGGQIALEVCWAEKRSLTTVPAKPWPNSLIAAAAERLRPCRNTVTTGVTITHTQPRRRVGLLPTAARKTFGLQAA